MNASVLNSPTYDLTGGWIFYLFYFAFGCGVFMAIILLETLVLRAIKWGPIQDCFRDSVIANLITTIIGYFVAQDIYSGIRSYLIRLLWNKQLYPYSNDKRFGSPILYDEDFHMAVTAIVMWVITVVIEGLVLLNIRDEEAPKTWAASLVINTASYVALYFLLGFRYWLDMIM